MKQGLFKRLEAVERRVVYIRPVEDLSTMESARIVAFTMAEGAEAGPGTEAFELARKIASALAKYAPAKQEPGAMIMTETDTTTDPALPPHPYIYIEAGARARSGHRFWLGMSGAEVLKVFGGPDARRLARDWVGSKFNASPYQEIDNPIEEDAA